MEKKAEIITDKNGKKIVRIPKILFKGKRQIPWDDVKNYLEQYVGMACEIEDTGDIIYIGNDLPDEYTGSKYTYSLKGANAKAKANAAQGIPELLKIATGKYFRENSGEKHRKDAAYGWYRYDSRFALPVYNEQDKEEHYNVYHASVLIRHDKDGNYYLYDIFDIKKKRATLSNPKILLGKKPISLTHYFNIRVKVCQ